MRMLEVLNGNKKYFVYSYSLQKKYFLKFLLTKELFKLDFREIFDKVYEIINQFSYLEKFRYIKNY